VVVRLRGEADMSRWRWALLYIGLLAALLATAAQNHRIADVERRLAIVERAMYN
jgi:hypothetical protein